MKTLPDTHVRAASRCPSPVTIWQTLLTRLLDQHYGLTLNDTPFADERVIEQHIEAGISLCDAVNFLVEKYALVRTDRKRAARTVLTGMCYSVGSATRQGSSSPTRFIGQSAMTSRT